MRVVGGDSEAWNQVKLHLGNINTLDKFPKKYYLDFESRDCVLISSTGLQIR